MDNCGLCRTARFIPVPAPYMTTEACQKLLEKPNITSVPLTSVACPICQAGGNQKAMPLAEYVSKFCPTEAHLMLTTTMICLWLIMQAGFSQAEAVEIIDTDAIPGLSSKHLNLCWIAFYSDEHNEERKAELARLVKIRKAALLARAVPEISTQALPNLAVVDKAKLEEIPF